MSLMEYQIISPRPCRSIVALGFHFLMASMLFSSAAYAADSASSSQATPEGQAIKLEAASDKAQSASNKVPEAIKTLYENKTDYVKSSYKDLDEDEVSDRLDHCLNTDWAIAQTGQVDQTGCELDSDGDGVFDRWDYCPNTPKGILVNFLGCEGDEDRDSVLDSKDRCPGTPYGVKVDVHGCKVDMDRDGDGVFDKEDMCPNTPKGAKVNKFGCQPREKVITNIVFNTASYEIRADQKPTLEHDVSRLAELKPGEVLVIVGYTDNRGCSEGNLKLSWNRAQSTKDFLVKEMNLPADRIFVYGRGEAAPIATNDTSEGRQKNRRIELEIIPQETLPKGAKRLIPPEMTDYVRGYCSKRGLK